MEPIVPTEVRFGITAETERWLEERRSPGETLALTARRLLDLQAAIALKRIEIPDIPIVLHMGPRPPWWSRSIHNVIAHPLLVLCPPLGEWLHQRTEP